MLRLRTPRPTKPRQQSGNTKLKDEKANRYGHLSRYRESGNFKGKSRPDKKATRHDPQDGKQTKAMIENINVKGELILTLESKQDWIEMVPKCLPAKIRSVETWLWVDTKGNILRIGEDFEAASNLESYPVRVYRLQRAAEEWRRRTYAMPSW
jgi:hypothetical protein